ncbi:GMC family oxidoreductase [Roseivivax isoporae]|uniref:GMC oxidoreductase n=1 Tax=Roseivivax isoporae LMG 25204 TaxID=1449351 RepID=X7FEC1_9RHOB|nr:GMC family oxidoreductase N-terminal domain-containing protein [Roseivivax isoporae]ETX30379.1 GMC oxidoreductase [Roseivivax isoporae LMG 25204]
MEEGSYDFVVIGAGSAGCVVAGRLSDAGHKVLLLEAGGRDRNPWIHIPLGYAKLYANPTVNWCYRSEPEPNLNGRRLFQPRGKVLGGTGSINGMIYMRGQPEDFDGWARAGCDGWSWAEVLPYFKKCEDQERGPDQFHGTGGPVAVSDLPEPHVLGEAFHAASEALGSPRNDDFNGAAQLGTGYVQTTTRRARRWSTARGYLTGRMARNIDIRTGALVERIGVESGRAVSVTWKGPGGRRVTRPAREIVLCGGVYNSPQILQRSGLGPADLLRGHGIDVVRHMPDVGEHLQDHFGIGLEFRSRERSTVNDIYNNPLLGGRELLRYILFRTGPFADNGNYSNTFIRTAPHIATPDMMVTFMAWCTGEDLRPRPFSGFTILAEHIRPEARGHCRLSGPRPTDPPSIRFNFLETEADRDAALAGLKFGRRISRTEPMAACVEAELSPGEDARTDDDLLAHCRANGLSLLHGVGTCRMGPAADGAVVDPRLRVHGVAGLRVIDASIMPRIVSGNTNAAAIMIGEKGTDMVLEDCRARAATE